jgi:4-cresol dehydrogenase (hydroxylating) flavoprotein subunit
MNSATSFDDCAAAYWKTVYPISRAPLEFQEGAVARLEPFPELCAAIKRTLALNGILYPGRYGIG